jgi:hypothetical protein
MNWRRAVDVRSALLYKTRHVERFQLRELAVSSFLRRQPGVEVNRPN